MKKDLVELAKCGGRATTGWTKAFEFMADIGKTIFDSVDLIPSPEPIIEAIEQCIADKPSSDNNYKEPWGDDEVKLSDDTIKILKKFTKVYIYQYYKQRYSSGIITKWYKPILIGTGDEVRSTILRPIVDSQKSERSVKVIRKVYTQVQSDTKYTYSTASFYDEMKKPLHNNDIKSTTQPNSLVAFNKEQLERAVQESPWSSDITPVASFEQLKREADKLNNMEKADLINYLFDKVDWSTEQQVIYQLFTKCMDNTENNSRFSIVNKARDKYLLRNPGYLFHHYLWLQEPSATVYRSEDTCEMTGDQIKTLESTGFKLLKRTSSNLY